MMLTHTVYSSGWQWLRPDSEDERGAVPDPRIPLM